MAKEKVFWEYEVLSIEKEDMDLNSISLQLRLAGEYGFELVSVVYNPVLECLHMFLKKPTE